MRAGRRFVDRSVPGHIERNVLVKDIQLDSPARCREHKDYALQNSIIIAFRSTMRSRWPAGTMP